LSTLWAPLCVAAPCLLGLAGLSCNNGSAAASAQAFDADRAWAHLEKQVGLGPRPSGTPAIEECRKYLEAELTAAGLTPKRETWRETTPVGEIEFVNVWAEKKGSDPEKGTIILGSHYDTKRMPFPFVGANDGGSSTAVLLEVARTIAHGKPSAFTYRFLFLDGEEATQQEWIGQDNTYGSRHHAQAIRNSGDDRKMRAFVLLDMVGDKNLVLQRETYSEGRFLQCFTNAARENGLGQHVDGKTLEIKDDHQSFMAVNIKSVDLIDFDYGPNNSWWHSKDDVLANCSKESLDAVGKITLLGLGQLEKLLDGR
jgi:glutaminyl-peptide cyclotransferase